MATQEKKSLVEEFRERLEKRKEELQPVVSEFHEVTSALDRLDVKEGTAPAAQRQNGRSSSRRGRPRGGGRRDEFVKLVRSNPGITIRQAAEKMGLKQANYLYRISSQLEDEKVIKKDGGGFVPVS